MNKMSFRVSGARVGDSVRPTNVGRAAAPQAMRRSNNPLGLRARPVPQVLKASVVCAFGPEDYATAEDYE